MVSLFLILSANLTRTELFLFLLTPDGTLTPIVKNPAAAVPSASLLESLAKLTSDPKNVVYIISGRDGGFLEEHLGHIENLGMSAEHGCFLRGPGIKEWVSLTDDLNMDWKKDVLQIFRCKSWWHLYLLCLPTLHLLTLHWLKDYEARTQGSFVEVKVSSVTFHYRNADPVFGLFQGELHVFCDFDDCRSNTCFIQPKNVKQCSKVCRKVYLSMF